jgi:multidrug efflux pump subunit AcrB
MRPRLARVAERRAGRGQRSDTREIEVVTDPAKLLSARLTVRDVAEKLKAANQLAPVGRCSSGGVQRLVLASGLWSSVQEIGETPVSVRPDGVLRVKDVGQVFPGAPDRVGLITGNGRDAASVSVSQQVGANILDIESGVQEAVDELARALPAGLHITKVYDLAEFVGGDRQRPRNLIGGSSRHHPLLFLRDWRLLLVRQSRCRSRSSRLS